MPVASREALTKKKDGTQLGEARWRQKAEGRESAVRRRRRLGKARPRVAPDHHGEELVRVRRVEVEEGRPTPALYGIVSTYNNATNCARLADVVFCFRCGQGARLRCLPRLGRGCGGWRRLGESHSATPP
jgi:hypothetical protein